jgi:hypothetical protein
LIELNIDSEEEPEIVLESDSVEAINNDYNKLKNKPTLDGIVIEGDIQERDPTVPDWAKQSTKPQYTAEETGAVDAEAEMSFATIKEVWDQIFK